MKKIVFYSLLIVFISCKRDKVIPSVYKNIAEEKIETKQGITYCNGKIFSGWLYTLNENNDTTWLSSFVDGKQNGTERKWYAKGLLMEERYFEDGRKEKIHKGYWENGRVKFEYHFENDEYEGLQQECFADGKIYRQMNYKEGHELGMQKMYRSDGTYVFNYEAKNGRMYGLTGTKNCKNVSEGITHN